MSIFNTCIPIGFLDPFPPNVSLDVRCDTSDHLTGWSLSPDGTAGSAKMINTSLAKYTMSDNTLSINGVDASDEGIYRCVHRTGNVSRLCIYAYGKSVIYCINMFRVSLCIQPEQYLLPAQAVMMDAVTQKTSQSQQERASILMPRSFIHKEGTVVLHKLLAV